jgi:mannose/fructose-specific phosphotransferase system component IIA
MNATYATFIIAHEDLAPALLHTVEKVLGKQENVFAYSNKHDSLQVLSQKLKDKVNQLKIDHLVFFTDLKGGSCWTISNMLRKEFPDMIIFSGVNLPMLVAYFNNFRELSLDELIKKVGQDACRGITSLSG